MSQRNEPTTLLAIVKAHFERALGSAEGSWTLAFAALASGYTGRKPAFVLLVGTQPVTSVIAEHVVSMFPKDDVHCERAGYRGLSGRLDGIARSRTRSRTQEKQRVLIEICEKKVEIRPFRLLFLPDVDTRSTRDNDRRRRKKMTHHKTNRSHRIASKGSLAIKLTDKPRSGLKAPVELYPAEVVCHA